MAGLPRRFAKMGFKRGWAAFNRTKLKKRTTRKVRTMAKRRRIRRFSKKSFAKGFSMGNISKILIGAGLAAVYEVVISPKIPLDGMTKNLVELAVGVFLAAMPGMPMPVRAFGAALATINAYSLIVPYVQGYAGDTTSGSSSW